MASVDEGWIDIMNQGFQSDMKTLEEFDTLEYIEDIVSKITSWEDILGYSLNEIINHLNSKIDYD